MSDHVHGTGEGQHVHEGWVPDKVIERLKRDGFCGARVNQSICMRRDEHDHQGDFIDCLSPVDHTHEETL